MSEKTQENQGQDSPRSVRLWRDNAIWLDGMATMYKNFNAALNIAIMRARGCGDVEVEDACKEYQKGGRRYERK